MSEILRFNKEGEGWSGPLPDILIEAEVARFFRESTTTIRSLLKKGKFPHAYRLNNSWRIPKEDVEAFARSMYGDTRLNHQRAKDNTVQALGLDDTDRGVDFE